VNESAKATVEITRNEDGTWLNLGDSTISLSNSPGQNIHEFFAKNLLEDSDHPVRRARHVVTAASKKAIAYTTGVCALLIVVVSASMAVFYAATHGLETLNNLATSTLTGIGMAIGGCLGSALILRFKAARHYIRSVLKDLQ